MSRIHRQRSRRSICLGWCVALVSACAHGATQGAEGSAMEVARRALGGAPPQARASEPTAGTLLAASPAAPAQPAPDARPSAAELERAADGLAATEARSAQADAAYSRMKRSRRPRGAARDAIVRERSEARQALVEAREHCEALQRRARGAL